MDINTKTLQSNTFSKGMNTDLSDALIGNDQYRLANNLRFVTNADENTGELHLIEGASHEQYNDGGRQQVFESETIIASTEIRDYGVIITHRDSYKNSNNETVPAHWSVWRFEKDAGYFWIVKIDDKYCKLPENKRLSLVTKYEDEDNIKVYIADGEHPIAVVNIMYDTPNHLPLTDYLKITSVPTFDPVPPTFEKIITGNIKNGNIQYSYQLYNTHSNFTETSIPTRIIPLYTGNVDLSDIRVIKGVEQDKLSGKGIRLGILILKNTQFDYIKIYRITYVEAGQLPLIECICDRKITDDEKSEGLTFDDIGQTALEIITLEEYNGMSGIHVIPRVIESKDDYMFAANIKTQLSEFDKILNEIKDKFRAPLWANDAEKANILDLSNNHILNLYGYTYSSPDWVVSDDATIKWEFILADHEETVLDEHDNEVSLICAHLHGDLNGMTYKGIKLDSYSYANPKNVYDYTSLRRNELYRYGIIWYNTQGEKSSVFWIADIRTPYCWEQQFEPFDLVNTGQTPPQNASESSFGASYRQPNDYYTRLDVNPLGIKFTINTDAVNDYLRSKHADYTILGAEIVRAQRTINDIATVAQGVISRPGQRVFRIGHQSGDGVVVTDDFPLTPTGYLTTSSILYTDETPDPEEYIFAGANETGGDRNEYRYTNYIRHANNTIYLFVCPEVCYLQESFQDLLKTQGYFLLPVFYLYPPKYDTATDRNGTSENGFYCNFGEDKMRYCASDSHNNGAGLGFKYILTPHSDKLVSMFSKDSSYIKLYKYANTVLLNDTTNVTLYNITPPVVRNTAIASALRWDDLAEGKNQSSNGESYPLKYTDKLTNIGNRSFVNWVAGNLYDVSITDPGGDMAYLEQHEDTRNTIMGPGGKCALLQLDIDPGSGLVPNHVFCTTCTEHNASNGTLIKESIVGTYLCNLRQNVIPYGGTSETALASTTYMSMGYYISFAGGLFEEEIDTYGGDTFIQPFEYVSMHRYYHNKITPYHWGKERTQCIVYSIPVETSINIAYSYGFEYSKNGYPVDIQDQPGDVYGKFTQDTPLYMYNGAYSSNSKAKVYAAYQDDPSNIKSEDYRCYYSAPKSNNEKQDNWLLYQPANFLDVDTRMGPITGLRRFHNNLVFWLEMAAGLFSVNERTTITDDSNLPLLLGTGGILARYDYINTSNGMHEGEFADAQSDSTLYWWDHNKWELCAYAGGQESVVLSKVKGVQNFLNKQRDANKGESKPMLAFDKLYNELIAHVTNGDDYEAGSLIYSEQLQAFSSLYTIKPKYKMSFADSLYLSEEETGNSVMKWNEPVVQEGSYRSKSTAWPGVLLEELKPYLKYIVNDNASLVKVFDTCTFGGRFYKGEIVQTEDSSHNVLANPIPRLKFKFKTPLKQEGRTDALSITDREYDFRFAIPRAGLEVDHVWTTGEFGDRMRGKTMQCELWSDSNDLDFSLQYITTKYRISWS